jgi:hypothetical protein
MKQLAFGQAVLNRLYDTHLRNLFAFHTIAHHEKLSNDGRSYYQQMGRVLANQNDRINALVGPAHRRQIINSLTWPTRPFTKGLTPVNASIDITQVLSTDEIVGLIAPESGAQL